MEGRQGHRAKVTPETTRTLHTTQGRAVLLVFIIASIPKYLKRFFTIDALIRVNDNFLLGFLQKSWVSHYQNALATVSFAECVLHSLFPKFRFGGGCDLPHGSASAILSHKKTEQVKILSSLKDSKPEQYHFEYCVFFNGYRLSETIGYRLRCKRYRRLSSLY